MALVVSAQQKGVYLTASIDEGLIKAGEAAEAQGPQKKTIRLVRLTGEVQRCGQLDSQSQRRVQIMPVNRVMMKLPQDRDGVRSGSRRERESSVRNATIELNIRVCPARACWIA